MKQVPFKEFHTYICMKQVPFKEERGLCFVHKCVWDKFLDLFLNLSIHMHTSKLRTYVCMGQVISYICVYGTSSLISFVISSSLYTHAHIKTSYIRVYGTSYFVHMCVWDKFLDLFHNLFLSLYNASLCTHVYTCLSRYTCMER